MTSAYRARPGNILLSDSPTRKIGAVVGNRTLARSLPRNCATTNTTTALELRRGIGPRRAVYETAVLPLYELSSENFVALPRGPGLRGRIFALRPFSTSDRSYLRTTRTGAGYRNRTGALTLARSRTRHYTKPANLERST